MKDRLGREIHYMRISATDRCNLRCRYCMPDSPCFLPEAELLSYEELLRICACAVKLGINCFKITGGEPLVRPGLLPFLKALKSMEGVRQVTLTTNGLLLGNLLSGLCEIGIDGLNISLDTLDSQQYTVLTGGGTLEPVLQNLKTAVASPIPVKLNGVLLPETISQILPLAALAEQMAIDVRFIEIMPVGYGKGIVSVPSSQALQMLQNVYPDLTPCAAKRGNGPAHYWESSRLKGKLGLIDAVSNRFCEQCNRVRLTCTGYLKPCLCFESGIDLKEFLAGGEQELLEKMRTAIWDKPISHCFSQPENMTETHMMSQIGG